MSTLTVLTSAFNDGATDTPDANYIKANNIPTL